MISCSHWGMFEYTITGIDPVWRVVDWTLMPRRYPIRLGGGIAELGYNPEKLNG